MIWMKIIISYEKRFGKGDSHANHLHMAVPYKPVDWIDVVYSLTERAV